MAFCTLVLAACSGEAPAPAQPEEGAPVEAPAANAHATVASPSFDCSRADGEAMEMVCSDADLAAMDRELDRLYKLAVATPDMDSARANELKAMQRGWVKGRDECWKASDKRQCVMTSYAMRIHEIRQGYANARSDDGAGASLGPLAFACEGQDFGVSATFVNTDPGAVALQWLENSLALAHVPSGSGAKYEGTWNDQEASLFTQGDEAMLTLPGVSEKKCKIEEIG
ncbi:MAG: MliC family protein [Novosphingobium sp.]|nr:MliC family protein [Novosphingobium sp.]